MWVEFSDKIGLFAVLKQRLVQQRKLEPVFSKRERITLRLLYAIAIPSVVCRLSVCNVGAPYTKPVELFGNFFHHTIAQGLYFSDAKNRWWGRPFPPEICVQSDPPPFKQRNFDQYRLIAPQP